MFVLGDPSQSCVLGLAAEVRTVPECPPLGKLSLVPWPWRVGWATGAALTLGRGRLAMLVAWGLGGLFGLSLLLGGVLLVPGRKSPAEVYVPMSTLLIEMRLLDSSGVIL